jgi:hypothetical protein
MWNHPMIMVHRVMIAAIVVIAAPFDIAAAQLSRHLFDDLPRPVQNEIREARKFCKEAEGERPNANIDDGIREIDLNGDRSRDIIVDWLQAGCSTPGGGGCSNRGCPLEIYKQTGPAAWTKIFDEPVIKYFISLTYNGRFRILAVSVVGGNSQCKAATLAASSHEYCDALVYWKNGRWEWRPIK